METIERILDSGLRVDITHRVEALNPPHPHHSIAMEVFKLHFELHSQRGDLAAAAKAQCQFIACHKAIHGEDYRNEALGFAYERLGGIHERARNWSGAEDAYKEAVQILQLNRGCMSQPYSRCAIEKLVCVQNPNSSIADYQRCGLCGIDAPRKCSRCGETHYCCREHQKAHWVVHRKICKRI